MLIVPSVLSRLPGDFWIRPSGHIVGSGWSAGDAANAYDGNTATYALGSPTLGQWSGMLELTLTNPVYSDKISYWLDTPVIPATDIEVSVWYGSAWHVVYSGAPLYAAWQEKSLGTSYQTVSKIGFRCRDTNVATGKVRLAEVRINEVR